MRIERYILKTSICLPVSSQDQINWKFKSWLLTLKLKKITWETWYFNSAMRIRPSIHRSSNHFQSLIFSYDLKIHIFYYAAFRPSCFWAPGQATWLKPTQNVEDGNIIQQGLLCEGSFVDVRICCSDHSASDGLGAHRCTSLGSFIVHDLSLQEERNVFKKHAELQGNIMHRAHRISHILMQGCPGCSLSHTSGTESSSGGQWGWRYGKCSFDDEGRIL